MKNRMIRKIAGFASAVTIASSISFMPVAAAEPAGVKAGTAMKSVSDNFFHGIDRNQSTNEKEHATSAERKTGAQMINGQTVYYDQFGNKVSGTLETREGTYRFDENGQKMTGFVEVDGKTAYFDEETGIKAETAQKVEQDGKTYILNDQGELGSGWTTFEGKDYYLDADGSVVKNGTRDIDGARYSFNEEGMKETSVTKDGYIYDETGKGVQDPSRYDKIAQAALAQLGVGQDCTMLVTNSLAAVGINFHGAPEAYLSLGPMTNDPVPGDICVYSGHVAIYIGNGQAVHGGWNGGTTAVFSVQCNNPLIGYVHPILP